MSCDSLDWSLSNLNTGKDGHAGTSRTLDCPAKAGKRVGGSVMTRANQHLPLQSNAELTGSPTGVSG